LDFFRNRKSHPRRTPTTISAAAPPSTSTPITATAAFHPAPVPPTSVASDREPFDGGAEVDVCVDVGVGLVLLVRGEGGVGDGGEGEGDGGVGDVGEGDGACAVVWPLVLLSAQVRGSQYPHDEKKSAAHAFRVAHQLVPLPDSEGAQL
jgi:hypothetical protein